MRLIQFGTRVLVRSKAVLSHSYCDSSEGFLVHKMLV